MRILPAILFGSLILAAPAHGCGVCYSFAANPLALPHPRAIEIAVATRTALDRGLLKTRTSSGRGWNTRPTGASSLKAWAQVASSTIRTGQKPFSLHVVLVDSAESYAIHVRAGHLVLDSRVSDRPDAVVATTQVALQAVLSGDIPWERAVECGLLNVEGSEECARVLAPSGL